MIVRGTTPTIRFTFTEVDPSDIVTAFLTISCNGLVIERGTDTMTTGEGYVEWNLTQEETLSLKPKTQANVQMRYRTKDNKAYATNMYHEAVSNVTKDGVI